MENLQQSKNKIQINNIKKCAINNRALQKLGKSDQQPVRPFG